MAERREFLMTLARSASVAPGILALLEGTASPLTRGEERDFAILSAALALEHEAVALYDVGIREKAFPDRLMAYAVEFRGDHQGHRDTQIAIVRDRGGHAPEPLRHYEFPKRGDGFGYVRLALDLEVAAQQAYVTLLSHIASRDYLLSAAFILVDEVRHMTVWRRVLGERIY